MTTRTAQCCCGRLTARCSGEPVSVALCHCLECQRRTGSTHGVAAFFEAGQVETAGEARTYARISDQGQDVTFHFCPDCGSTVWWEPGRLPGRIAVAVGTFADPAFPRPEKAVYTEHRHPWLEVPDG